MLLELENLCGGYGGPDIVKDVTCGADAGEILCLAGPNGCGKTTLFRLILGLLPITGGCIRLDGSSAASLSPDARAGLIAYIPQHHAPVFAYTALEIVIMGRARYFSAFSSPKPADRDAAFDALEKVNATHLANQSYTALSGGQRQLVLLARAICQSARIFVMDEPGASLDYANQRLLLDVVAALAENGTCVVMSTHSPEHPASVGHKVLLMRDGRMAAFGKPADVLTPDVLERVYGVEMDVAHITDRYGVRRTVCLPVKKSMSIEE